MLALHTTSTSEPGLRPRNEDASGHRIVEQAGCWVVSDGAGGHGSGDIAAQMVVSSALEHFEQSPEISPEAVSKLLETAQNAVMTHKRANPEGDNMHATAAVLLIDNDALQACWGHAGDTRIYLFRRRRIVAQTRDHSLIQNLIDAGYGSTAMLRNHPQRSLLTSAIGNAEELTISVTGATTPLEEGDIFLMCTDGWWEHVEEHLMESLLEAADDTDEWLRSMARHVQLGSSKHSDNYTAVAVQIGKLDPVTTVIRLGGMDE